MKTIFSILFVLATCSMFATAQEKTSKEIKGDAYYFVYDFEKAKDDYLKDVELYRIENATKIEANNKSIEEFKSRIDSQKKEAKEDYKAKIADIEAQNTDIKKQMDEYKANGKDHWEAFKINYNRNMENLMRSIMNLK